MRLDALALIGFVIVFLVHKFRLGELSSFLTHEGIKIAIPLIFAGAAALIYGKNAPKQR